MKSAKLYLLNSPLPDTPALAESLEEAPARRCQFDEESHIGFRPPLSREAYALDADGLTLFTAEVTKVVLPAKVVKRETTKKLEEVSTKYGRDLSDDEKQQIKEAVRTQLIARSHQVSDQVELRLDRSRSLLALDVSSAKKADDVLSKLREVLGSLKVVPFATQEGAAPAMTRWLAQGRPDPASWRFSGSCRLSSAEDDGSQVVFDKCALVHERDAAAAPEDVESLGPSAEVEACLQQGRQCTEAKFEIEEIGEFVLTHNLSMKSMKFSGQVPEPETDDAEEARRLSYEATARLEWGLIGRVVDDLQAYLGEARIEAEDLEDAAEPAGEMGDAGVDAMSPSDTPADGAGEEGATPKDVLEEPMASSDQKARHAPYF